MYKIKVNTINFIKIKNFCSVKGPVKRMKRQPIEYEKMFANHISEKGIKNSQNSTIKPKQSHQKMSKRHEKTFYQRGNTDGQKAHEKMFNIISHQGKAN